MNIKERAIYNSIAREKFEEVIRENGMKMIFASKKCEIENTTLSKWRNKVFDFKEDKLSKVENFINNYY